jgi:hypothetical protein
MLLLIGCQAVCKIFYNQFFCEAWFPSIGTKSPWAYYALMKQTYTNRLEYEANRLINEAIFDASTALASGLIEDIKDYKFRVGIIKGLEQAKELIAEADRIITTGERS